MASQIPSIPSNDIAKDILAMLDAQRASRLIDSLFREA
jgi:hypothetical protein